MKELKEKWRKWRKAVWKTEEKMGTDREKQWLWPKINENLLPDPLGNQAAHMGPPYPKLFHLIIPLFTVPCWTPEDRTDFVPICTTVRDLEPLPLSWWGWEMWTRQAQHWEEGRSTQNCLEATAWCLKGLATFGCWAVNGQGKLENISRCLKKTNTKRHPGIKKISYSIK